VGSSIANPFGIGDPLQGPANPLRPPALRGCTDLMDLRSWVRAVEHSDPQWFAARSSDERELWESWKYSAWMDRLVEHRTTERLAGIMHRSILQHAFSLHGGVAPSSAAAAAGTAAAAAAGLDAGATGEAAVLLHPQDAQEQHAADILLMANTLRQSYQCTGRNHDQALFEAAAPTSAFASESRVPDGMAGSGTSTSWEREREC